MYRVAIRNYRDRGYSVFYPILVFVINIFVVWRLLRSEYIDQLPSIEGAFISLARYIHQHWPGYDWFPLWFGGFPFARSYQPGLHYAVAVFSALSGWSAASAYHFVTAVTYSLAGVAFYYLAKTLGATRHVALGGALVFSLFSPSLLLLHNVRNDAGGLWQARRLQAMVVYGEGPNITGLMLAMFALALLYRALKKKRPGTALAAAMAIAVVPATNWPATVALCFGITACLLAFGWKECRPLLPRVVTIGALALCFASPFALPSTVWSTFHNANVMADAPSAGAARWMVLILLVSVLACTRWVLSRCGASYALRFAILYALLPGWVVLSAAYLHINLVPQPMRFHVALEIPMVLALVFFAQWLLQYQPRLSAPLAVLVLLFCTVQTYHFRQHSRTMARRLDIQKTLEYEEAQWLVTNLPGQRVAVPGTVSFWMNSFTDTPQFSGCCEQSIINPQNFIASYVVGAGYLTDAESADYSLLWMKAWAVHAVGIGGPASREAYKAFQFPWRFRDRLPLLWRNGDDSVYRVPERTAGLARVVKEGDLVKHAPANGIDDKELRPFVAALDDQTLPVASFEWRGPNAAHISGVLQPDQAVSVAMNYQSGWTASVNGKALATRADGLGLLAVEPRCAGNCVIDLRWSPGPEPWFAWAFALSAFAGALVWWQRERAVRRYK